MPGIRHRSALTAGFAVLLAVTVGCSQDGGVVATVGAADLQKDLLARLAAAGTPPKSVTCEEGLTGVVGRTAECEVQITDTNSVMAVLTTLKAQGDNVDYEITGPRMTKAQLAGRVAALASSRSATCDSGLDGHQGDWTACEVEKSGVTVRQVVEVSEVRDLLLDLTVTPALPKRQAEDMLLAKLTPVLGFRPDSAECPGDLLGEDGGVMECVVTADGNPDTYVLTVREGIGSTVEFDYQNKVAANGLDPDIDYCRGCPG